MIRSVATLFAKKTAVVAVSGVVILGGATLALAEVTEDPPVEDPPCVDVEETPEDECATDTSTPEDEVCVDDTLTTDVDECATDPSVPEGEGADDDETDDEGTDDEEELDGDEDETEEPATEEVAEDVAEESHGEVVSEAARVTCWEQAYLDYYGNHGQCVKTFAHGEGLTLEEVEAAIAARDAAAAQVTEPAGDGSTSPAITQTSKPGKGHGGGKPAKAGHGGGKGNGKKG